MNIETPGKMKRAGARPLTGGTDPDGAQTTNTGLAAGVSQLLKSESDVRRAENLIDVDQLIVNESRSLLRARQTLLLDASSGRWKVVAISNVAQFDRSGPLASWTELIAANLARDVDPRQRQEFALPAYGDPAAPLTREYPFRNVLWLPLWSPRRTDQVALLLLREQAWLEADRRIAARLSESFGHARAFRSEMQRPLRVSKRPKWRWLAAGAIMIALSFWPVSLSVLAPVEVVPRDADIVAMPMDGIVEKVLVRPSELVRQGQPLIRLVDTIARNKLDVAAREVAVAEARVERASSMAFTDLKGRQELGIARAELQLKLAEHAYAKENHDQTTIRAPSDGVALFSDAKHLQGRPVTTGQRLLHVARPDDTELQIQVPVADSIVLHRGFAVRAFLDTDPLRPIDGEVTFIDHQARIREGSVAGYQVVARTTGSSRGLTLGSHGTAQIRGPRMPLAVYLFRRPLNYVRQWLGL